MNIQIIRILIEFTSTNFTDYSNNRLKKCKISTIDSSFIKTVSYSSAQYKSLLKSETNSITYHNNGLNSLLFSKCRSISDTMKDIKNILE
jgi:hypothetical protein